jgi:thioredoxin reductase (NADPH)
MTEHLLPSSIIVTDVVVIGAGPVGLYQVFQLGLLEVKCHVIDAWSEAGGQPVALYPDKPIYDVPGLPACGGRELAQRLLTQIKPFAVPMHFGHQVNALHRLSNGQWMLTTDQGQCFQTRVVIIAAGVGAFQAKQLRVEGLASLQMQGRWMYHPAPVTTIIGEHPLPFAHEHVLIVGGDGDAVDDALAFLALPSHQQPKSITLLHRRAILNADADQLVLLQNYVKSGAIEFITGQIVSFTEDRVNGDTNSSIVVTLETPEGAFISRSFSWGRAFLGLSPKLGPISEWGLAMHRKQLAVDSSTMQTSETGVFAVGDVNTYLGKKKLLVCGFHETVMAAFAIATALHPERPPVLEYTTSSTRLHFLLGLV